MRPRTVSTNLGFNKTLSQQIPKSQSDIRSGANSVIVDYCERDSVTVICTGRYSLVVHICSRRNSVIDICFEMDSVIIKVLSRILEDVYAGVNELNVCSYRYVGEFRTIIDIQLLKLLSPFYSKRRIHLDFMFILNELIFVILSAEVDRNTNYISSLCDVAKIRYCAEIRSCLRWNRLWFYLYRLLSIFSCRRLTKFCQPRSFWKIFAKTYYCRIKSQLCMQCHRARQIMLICARSIGSVLGATRNNDIIWSSSSNIKYQVTFRFSSSTLDIGVDGDEIVAHSSRILPSCELSCAVSRVPVAKLICERAPNDIVEWNVLYYIVPLLFPNTGSFVGRKVRPKLSRLTIYLFTPVFNVNSRKIFRYMTVCLNVLQNHILTSGPRVRFRRNRTTNLFVV